MEDALRIFCMLFLLRTVFALFLPTSILDFVFLLRSFKETHIFPALLFDRLEATQSVVKERRQFYQQRRIMLTVL